METMAGKKPRQGRSFTLAFKAEVVGLGDDVGTVLERVGLEKADTR